MWRTRFSCLEGTLDTIGGIALFHTFISFLYSLLVTSVHLVDKILDSITSIKQILHVYNITPLYCSYSSLPKPSVQAKTYDKMKTYYKKISSENHIPSPLDSNVQSDICSKKPNYSKYFPFYVSNATPVLLLLSSFSRFRIWLLFCYIFRRFKYFFWWNNSTQIFNSSRRSAHDF